MLVQRVIIVLNANLERAIHGFRSEQIPGGRHTSESEEEEQKARR